MVILVFVFNKSTMKRLDQLCNGAHSLVDLREFTNNKHHGIFRRGRRRLNEVVNCGLEISKKLQSRYLLRDNIKTIELRWTRRNGGEERKDSIDG